MHLKHDLKHNTLFHEWGDSFPGRWFLSQHLTGHRDNANKSSSQYNGCCCLRQVRWIQWRSSCRHDHWHLCACMHVGHSFQARVPCIGCSAVDDDPVMGFLDELSTVTADQGVIRMMLTWRSRLGDEARNSQRRSMTWWLRWAGRWMSWALSSSAPHWAPFNVTGMSQAE